ncbi:hypothetical protein CRG98_034266 [Punica granatum]|uniref:Transposase MuDR plant domain-containing protein n=1 Tax=Punica granatum TaxID=22663 RepID=A0A2I0IMV4_PUNGR|nr:hypothetical protein CRG98_034266 [Punica granatum]
MAVEGDSASDSNVYSSDDEEYGSERDNDEFMDGQRRKRISKKPQSVAPLQVRPVGSDYGDSSDEVITPNSTNDEGESSKMVKRSKTFNPRCDMKNITFKKDMWFESAKQFQAAVRDYAIYNGYAIKWLKSGARECSERSPTPCEA